jgi:hypothetical protein
MHRRQIPLIYEKGKASSFTAVLQVSFCQSRISAQKWGQNVGDLEKKRTYVMEEAGLSQHGAQAGWGWRGPKEAAGPKGPALIRHNPNNPNGCHWRLSLSWSHHFRNFISMYPSWYRDSPMMFSLRFIHTTRFLEQFQQCHTSIFTYGHKTHPPSSPSFPFPCAHPLPLVPTQKGPVFPFCPSF